MPVCQDSAGVLVVPVPLGGAWGSGRSGGLWGWWCRSPGAAPTNRGFARHILPHSSEMLPAPERCRERDFAVAGSIGRRRMKMEWLPPLCPTCLRVSLLQSQGNAAAGWVGGGELPLPGEMQQLSGFPQAPSCLELLFQPGGSCVFPAGLKMPSQPALQNPVRAVGSGWARSCPALLQLTWAGCLHPVP